MKKKSATTKRSTDISIQFPSIDYHDSHHKHNDHNCVSESPCIALSSKKKKKKNSKGFNDLKEESSHWLVDTRICNARAAKKTDQFWSTMSNNEERHQIREFWLQLGEADRRSLVKVEKEAVLRKMKEQQKHSCNCSVCGKKRTAIEDELEVLYDAYYEELERYANHQQQTRLYGAPYGLQDLTAAPSQSSDPPTRPDDENEDYESEYEYEDEEDEEDDEEDEDEEEENNEGSHSDHSQQSKHSRHSENSHHSITHTGESAYSDVARYVATDLVKHAARLKNVEEFNFGNSLSVKGETQTTKSPRKARLADMALCGGGILTVADDLLKNDGKKFLDMMERLAERRMQTGEEAETDQNEEYYEEGEDDEAYEEEEEGEEEEEDTRTEEQRMEEGRRMFQIFAARMFEQRVLAAYREKVARERQQRLLQEEEEEQRQREERERKKQEERERKKEQKRQLKQQREEERQAKELQKKAEEEAAKIEKERQMQIERQKREQERQKREEEKQKREEERARKEEERRKRVREEKERAAEKERVAEKERKRKEEEDERLRKEKEEEDERLRKEKEEEEERLRKEKEEHRLKEEERLAKEKVARLPDPVIPLSVPTQDMSVRESTEERQRVLMDVLIGPLWTNPTVSAPNQFSCSLPAVGTPSSNILPHPPTPPTSLPLQAIAGPSLLPSTGETSPKKSRPPGIGMTPSRKIIARPSTSLTPIGQPSNGRRASAASAASTPSTSTISNAGPIGSKVGQDAAEEAGHSFFSNFLFGEPSRDTRPSFLIPEQQDPRVARDSICGGLERRFSSDSSAFHWTNGWTASTVLSDNVHGKLFGDVLAKRKKSPFVMIAVIG
ncbi:salt tolerance down-regulator-domain-containing protein [Phycomyces blakesleeanus]